jgi:hypothetical protein
MLVPLLLQRCVADSAREFGDDDASERHFRETGRMARDGGFVFL